MSKKEQGSLTSKERRLYEEALERQDKQELQRRQEQYKPKEEFIASVGVCDESGQSHQVIKVTVYGWIPDDRGIIGPGSSPSIGETIRYFCKTCKVAFDRSIDPDYQEPPHPVPHRHAWY
jgi:hypothetical protein